MDRLTPRAPWPTSASRRSTIGRSGQRAEVLSYLKTLLAGKSFASSRRRAELLRYLV